MEKHIGKTIQFNNRPATIEAVKGINYIIKDSEGDLITVPESIIRERLKEARWEHGGVYMWIIIGIGLLLLIVGNIG